MSQWLSGLRCDQSFVKGTPNLTGAGGQMAFNDSNPRFEMEPVEWGPRDHFKTLRYFSQTHVAVKTQSRVAKGTGMDYRGG